MFKSDERDAFAESALRRFWSLVNPLPPAIPQTRLDHREARVVDLAQWVRRRARAEGP
jgi:hypothetical protein